MKKFLALGCAVVLCLSMTACSFGKLGTVNQKEPTTEEEVEEGFESSEDVITAYWKAFADVKKSAFRECFPDPDKASRKINIEDTVQEQYDLAKEMQDSVDIHLDDIEINTTKVDVDDYDHDVMKAYDVEKVEYCEVEVPITQVVDGTSYEVLDCYVVYTVRIDGNWYISELEEAAATVQDPIETPTTTPTVEEPTTTTEEEPTTTTEVGDPVSVNETDYSKVNWGVTYSPLEDMPGVTISVTPMIDGNGTYTLIVGVTNMYNVPINFSGQANAKDSAGNYIGDAFIYLSSIGYGNTAIATIYCPDGVPNGEIHWDELQISEGYSEYVPWAADWDATAPDANTLELSYSVTMTESTNPGDVYGLILDDKGFVIDVFHDYVSDKGTTVSSSTSKYRKDITQLGVSDVALFINPTK